MTPAEKATIAAASLALIAITGAVATGVFQVERSPDTEDPRRFTVQWPDGGTPDGGDVRCVWTTALVAPEVLAIYGGKSDAGSQYAYAYICAERLPDGGPSDEDPLPELPGGVEAMEFDQMEEPYDGGPRFVAILQGQTGWPCACSKGGESSNCEFRPWWGGGNWYPAPVGMTFGAGAWRGSDCFPKSCVEFAGTSSWPMECPTE